MAPPPAGLALTSTDAFQEVATILNAAGDLSAKANAALDPAVAAVARLAAALDDVDSFVSLLKTLDEAVTVAEHARSALSTLLEGIGVGEVLDALATALKAVQDVYKGPLTAVERIDADTVAKLKPTLDKLGGALQDVQKHLTLAAEGLPQYARTVTLVGLVMGILQAVIAAFPDTTPSSPGGRLKTLMTS